MDKYIKKLKDLLHKILVFIRTIWHLIKRKALQVGQYIQKLYRSVPVSNRIKVSVLLLFGFLILIMVALLCVPKTLETIPEEISLQSRVKGEGDGTVSGPNSDYEGNGDGQGNGAASTEAGSGTGGLPGNQDPRVLTSDVLPPSMSVPSIGQPTGGKAGHTPSANERAKWKQLLVYLEQCESFAFDDEDKEQKLGVAAARNAIELFDYRFINQEKTEYWIDENSFKNYYHLLFGQYLRGVKMNRIVWEQGVYHYTQPDGPISQNVAAEITAVYLLEGGFYRVEGIVTRGKEGEPGGYSRKLTMIITADPQNNTQYYVVSLENRETQYTLLQDLKEPILESEPSTVSQTSDGPDSEANSSNPETSQSYFDHSNSNTSISQPVSSEDAEADHSSETSKF